MKARHLGLRQRVRLTNPAREDKVFNLSGFVKVNAMLDSLLKYG